MIFLFIIFLFVIGYKMYHDDVIELRRQNLKQDIIKHYSELVKANKETSIFKLNGNKYVVFGKLGVEEELVLDKINVTYKDEYLKITSFDEEYYVYYKDVSKINELSNYSNRYEKYIPFNKNIVTGEETNFYDENGKLVYMFKNSFDLPILINKDNLYGIEYNGRLLYVKDEDVLEIKDSNNTDLKNTSGIAVLNYHFFYNTSLAGDSQKCNQVICLSTTNLRKHLDYIKNNNIFTPTMAELEMYIDGEVQLPKSVVLTIDDGWRADNGSNIMTEYELNSTVFLMSKFYNPDDYKTEYTEVHSHGHDLHNQGVCPGGQGGAIKCMEKSKLLQDLKDSKEKLYGTTVFCYPFYEYNNYSIEVLKEAGYTMAFGGSGEGGYYKVVPGINKFKLPRYVIYSYTSVNNIASYIN